jgi:hypothetical protein
MSSNRRLKRYKPAARLHIEHWMNFMVDLSTKKKDAMFRIPSVLFGTTSQAAELLGAA